MQVMLDENYLTGSLFGLLANLLLPLVPSYAYQVMQLLESIKAPTLHIFKLFFEIHSSTSSVMQQWHYLRIGSRPFGRLGIAGSSVSSTLSTYL